MTSIEQDRTFAAGRVRWLNAMARNRISKRKPEIVDTHIAVPKAANDFYSTKLEEKRQAAGVVTEELDEAAAQIIADEAAIRKLQEEIQKERAIAHDVAADADVEHLLG